MFCSRQPLDLHCLRYNLCTSIELLPRLYNSEQLLDEKKLEQVDDLYREFETPEKAGKM